MPGGRAGAPTVLTILAPVAGTVLALADVGDPAFGEGLLGPGFAVLADRGGAVLAPADGLLVATRSHAFVVRTSGRDVLVHLGLDTYDGPGSVDLVVGRTVRAGAVLGWWDHDAVVASGRSPACPVVAIGAPPGVLTLRLPPGRRVAAGDAVANLHVDPMGPPAARV